MTHTFKQFAAFQFVSLNVRIVPRERNRPPLVAVLLGGMVVPPCRPVPPDLRRRLVGKHVRTAQPGAAPRQRHGALEHRSRFPRAQVCRTYLYVEIVVSIGYRIPEVRWVQGGGGTSSLIIRQIELEGGHARRVKLSIVVGLACTTPC